MCRYNRLQPDSEFCIPCGVGEILSWNQTTVIRLDEGYAIRAILPFIGNEYSDQRKNTAASMTKHENRRVIEQRDNHVIWVV